MVHYLPLPVIWNFESAEVGPESQPWASLAEVPLFAPRNATAILALFPKRALQKTMAINCQDFFKRPLSLGKACKE